MEWFKVFVIGFLAVIPVLVLGEAQVSAAAGGLPGIKDVPASGWEQLSKKRIYFGHQSVGYNILEGIKDLTKDGSPVRLRIVETVDPGDFNTAIFGHSKVGKNRDPKLKLQDFEKNLEQGIGEKAEIAFSKFCYADFSQGADAGEIFAEYKSTMARLKKRYPRTIFIHVAAPLTAQQTGLKVWLKKTLGRPVIGFDDNMRINQFNELLRNEYEGKEPIFDLAKIESTHADGTRASFTEKRKVYFSLVPAYTYDGGHLNEKGRKLVAERLLVLLAELAGK